MGAQLRWPSIKVTIATMITPLITNHTPVAGDPPTPNTMRAPSRAVSDGGNHQCTNVNTATATGAATNGSAWVTTIHTTNPKKPPKNSPGIDLNTPNTR